MLTAKEASDVLKISNVRLKQILKADEYQFEREAANNGLIKIHPETMRTLLQKRNHITYPKKICVIGSQKGGTGKTISNIFVATRLAEKYGVRVLVADMDAEAHSTSFLLPNEVDIASVKTIYEIIRDNTDAKDAILKTRYENVSLLPAKGVMRRVDKMLSGSVNPKNLISKILKPQLKDFDIILIDIPPVYSTLIESCYLAADEIYLTTDASLFGLEALRMTFEDITNSCNEFDAKKPKISALMTRFNNNRKASKDAWEMLTKDFSTIVNVLPVPIKESAEVQNCVNDGRTIYETKTSAEIKVNFDELVDTLFPIANEEKKIH